MTDAARDIPRMSATEYLQMEKQATSKHEFVDGVVYAMAGASRRHNAIAIAIVGALNEKLANPCEAYALEVKVHNRAVGEEQYYYPDAVVTCSDLDNDDYLIRHPSLVIEVLSPTTEHADRGYKFDDYRKLPSLQEYVLVHQERPCIEIYRRRNGWAQETFEPDASITLECVDITLLVSALYRRVRLKNTTF